MFLTLAVFAFVDGAIRPRLQTKPVLFIVAPVTYIFCTIRVRVGATTIGFVVNPVSFINITISMVELALSVGFSIIPLADISASIEPFLLSVAITRTIQPLTLVDGTAVEVDRRVHFTHVLCVWNFTTNYLAIAEGDLIVTLITFFFSYATTIIHDVDTFDVLVPAHCDSIELFLIVTSDCSRQCIRINFPHSIWRCIFTTAVCKKSRTVSHISMNPNLNFFI